MRARLDAPPAPRPATWLCADALPWLAAHPGAAAIVTSLPDAAELDCPVAVWAAWFREAVRLCLVATPASAPAIFYQTDRRGDGAQVSKAALIFEVAAAAGARLVWHKIVLRRAPGACDLWRPGYAHLLAVSVAGRAGQATADVVPVGPALYRNGMPLAAAARALRFAARTTPWICDPFCGRGTVPALAAALGLQALGIDIDPVQIAAARALRVDPAQARRLADA